VAAASQLVFALSRSVAAAALAGAWAETVAYYATMALRECRSSPPLRAMRNLVLEFGAAKALDSLLLRPSLMFAASQLIADVPLGIAVGKLAADVVFYVPTITAYELRRRYVAT
jgi:hypothetical protein